VTDKERLDWLEANPQIEISYAAYCDDDVPWKAHRVSGGKNDREWDEIAEGESIREVIDAVAKNQRR
jgi:hypothetical protein